MTLRFEVLAAVKVKIVVSCSDTMQVCRRLQCFKGIYDLYVQGSNRVKLQNLFACSIPKYLLTLPLLRIPSAIYKEY